jgi:hypothetical protein
MPMFPLERLFVKPAVVSSMCTQPPFYFRGSRLRLYLLTIWHFSREFSHRVKSISMATFTPAEVQLLHDTGNLVRCNP